MWINIKLTSIDFIIALIIIGLAISKVELGSKQTVKTKFDVPNFYQK